jgi:membrane-associated protease RseP (regulator of RpoE activity)
MNRVHQIAIVAIALSTMAAAQATPAAPPAPPAPAVKARPAPAPAAPAAPAKPSSYLGIDIRNVTQERMADLKLKEARGVEVTLVDRDAPAGKAGLKERDVILSFNGRNIQGADDLRKLIRETSPGQAVELGISRDGQPMTLKAELADRRKVAMAPHVVIPRVRVRVPQMDIPRIAVLQYYRRSGVVVENLTPQLGEVFGVKNGEGVLVRSVDKDSAGEAAGVRAGDVIVRVGSESVANTSDWNRVMRQQKPGPVSLGIVREKRQQTVSLLVPERTREQSYAFPNMEDFNINMDEMGSQLDNYKNEMLELHRLQPEIERSMREAQESLRQELERSRREMERSQRDAERAQRDAERKAERGQRNAQRAQEQAQREQERAQREVERAQEQAQRTQEQAQREQERMQREQEKPVPPEKAPESPKPPQ